MLASNKGFVLLAFYRFIFTALSAGELLAFWTFDHTYLLFTVCALFVGPLFDKMIASGGRCKLVEEDDYSLKFCPSYVQ